MSERIASNVPVKSVHTAFRIIELLNRAESAGVTEIAAELGVAKSTAHDHLRTLEMQEYVVRDRGRYRLGLKFLGHGIAAKELLPIVQHARPSLEHVADETGCAVWLVIEEHGKAIYVDGAMGERAVPTTGGIGRRSPLHVLASGKAILANLPTERQEEIISRGLEEHTPDSITDPAELRRQLAEIRDRGVAFNRGESFTGIRAVACPVLCDDVVHGAVTCAGPEKRMKGDRFNEEVPDIVSAAGNELELKLSSP